MDFCLQNCKVLSMWENYYRKIIYIHFKGDLYQNLI